MVAVQQECLKYKDWLELLNANICTQTILRDQFPEQIVISIDKSKAMAFDKNEKKRGERAVSRGIQPRNR